MGSPGGRERETQSTQRGREEEREGFRSGDGVSRKPGVHEDGSLSSHDPKSPKVTKEVGGDTPSCGFWTPNKERVLHNAGLGHVIKNLLGTMAYQGRYSIMRLGAEEEAAETAHEEEGARQYEFGSKFILL
jgi:hypothetical protein